MRQRLREELLAACSVDYVILRSINLNACIAALRSLSSCPFYEEWQLLQQVLSDLCSYSFSS